MVEVSCSQDMQSAELNLPIVEGCVVTLGADEIIALLDGITATEDEHQLDTLHLAVEAVDGYGLFWSVLHTLEAIPGYESHLTGSVMRSPGEFTLCQAVGTAFSLLPTKEAEYLTSSSKKRRRNTP